MRRLDDDLWIIDAPHRFFGVRIRTRMTVVRLEGGALWLHSPVELTEERRRAVDELGSVRHVVAPNRFHHVYAGEWARAYPDAELWGAPGLPEKRTDLTFDHVLMQGDPPWGGEIEQLLLEGMAALREVVFYHRSSGTVVAADLFFNEHDPESLVTRAYLWVMGILGRPGISRLVKLAIDDRAALRRSYERILEWEFDRIVISHGEIVDRDARGVLRRIVDEDL